MEIYARSPKGNTLIFYQISQLILKERIVVSLENLYGGIVTFWVKDSKKLQLNEVLGKCC